ncbi:MAG: hypothetical protein KJ002_00040 [Candidatus Dadabacteria bacterium]|nr:hypothetical protein [Candidatus Dadabacteria bacterium]
MEYINSALSGLFGILVYPFRGMDPLWSLAFFSLLIGVLMLVIFRYTSNQPAIAEAKRKIRAYVYELSLFKDEVGMVLSAQRSILRENMKYIKYAVKPMLFMIIPLGLILVQLDSWYGHRALDPGERAVVSVRLAPGGDVMSNATLEAGPGLEIETPALRVPEQERIEWRIRAEAPGEHTLTFGVGGESFSRKVVVSDGGLMQLSPAAYTGGVWNILMNPGNRPIPDNPLVEEITVGYPEAEVSALGFKVHWLVIVFALSIVFGFALKGVFRVEI